MIGHRGKRLCALLLALGVNWLIEWYGGAFRYHYGTIGRMLDGVDQMPQLKFVLSNPLRFAAVLLGTLYENDFFIGQLGIFGNLDLPVGVINTTAGAMLLLGAVLGVVLAIMIMSNPFEGTTAVFMVIGISFIVDGLLDLYTILRVSNAVSKFRKNFPY